MKSSHKAKHLISIDDLSSQEIQTVFGLAQKIKKSPQSYRNALQGRMFGLIFEKPSTRTWISFEVGIQSMGGGTIYLGPEDIHLGVREAVKDVARVLDRYLDGVILRTFAHETIITFEHYFHKPVINGLSDFEHPCQALADFLTIREKSSARHKPILAYIGDGNNVLNSLILLAAKLGSHVRYATPANFPPSEGVLKKVREYSRRTGAAIEAFTDPKKAVECADFVYTDIWVSMGEEAKGQSKMQSFKGFQVNRELLRGASKGVKIMHCLPAHRGEEITDEVLEGKQSIVFGQAENRLHVQKAILIHLCT
ncbi:MAG: ornithine carbamoyltransferase [Candidatus Omnitrophica bacterium]|nr:ornithine carbamoyltransferase [Candidatus Omnitrophota bacterium]